MAIKHAMHHVFIRKVYEFIKKITLYSTEHEFPNAHKCSMEFIMLINDKMPTIVGILTFISMINTKNLKQEQSSFFGISNTPMNK